MPECSRHPVGLFFFNRKETALRVAQRILESNPPMVYLVADGPRLHRPGEAEKCAEVRQAIEGLPWKCPVRKVYSEVNLGCGKRISSGISAIFAQEECAIILEDDILPHADFFPFCDELLEYYRYDESVFMISGLQFQEKVGRNNSYSFDFNGGIWGWASWRRAWRHYQLDIANDAADDDLWSSLAPVRYGGDRRQAQESRDLVNRSLVRGQLDTWDYQWGICMMKNRAYGISPNWNLVENIGFGPDSTHTTGPASSHWAGQYRSYPVEFPLVHPGPGILSTAVSLVEKGLPEQALQIAKEGVRKFPRELRLHLCAATAALNLGRKEEARAACGAVLELEPREELAKKILQILSERENSTTKSRGEQDGIKRCDSRVDCEEPGWCG